MLGQIFSPAKHCTKDAESYIEFYRRQLIDIEGELHKGSRMPKDEG